MQRLCVMGLGYVGLPAAAMLAGRGHQVVGCDTDPRVVAAVQSGQAHFHEPDLDMLLAAALTTGRLTAQAVPAPAEVFVIAVPTPLGPGCSPRADLSCVEAATDAIAPLLRPGNLVILESTCPVGTTEALAARLAAARPDLALPRRGQPAPPGCVHLAHCPERVLPGSMLRELVANDRIIGGLTPACAELARAVYAGFVTGRCWVTDSRTAELAKLAENAFRDVNIAFANELASICEAVEVDPWAAITLANRHPRVAILQPGAGVGGHCIAVDPWFLAQAAPERSALIRTARGVNEAKPGQVAARIRALAGGMDRPAIACLGLTYKADVEDLRASPALAVAEDLARDGTLRLLCCDPMLPTLPPSLAGRPGVALVGIEAALVQADILAVLVPHAAFRALPPQVFADRVVVDTVGLLRQA
ncbi:UDP-N-acetyl-D-mannosamine dehydrogenase [Falsiroseomonas sp.]|uniref:UDP-N-acetyl-D-mannosamine dehydrogenase n=1 Tax=Falsiroseomonas sp. TaxID=2870721 RepID=UPI002732DDF1|nr:UDP-N-acetyl-D-mannosamine dehydrogenase [Falsiroseomonas sp.]MDP3417050.1 UDP-N-acetyl-D-mannosamine dehydrogenase [Falsiroseomonas sp.]